MNAPDIKLLLETGRKMVTENRLDEAIDYWKKLVSDFPKLPSPLISLANTLVKANHQGEALTVYKELQAKFPKSIYGWIGMAQVDESMHAWADAENKYIELKKLYSKNISLDIGLTRALIKQGKITEVLDLLNQIIEHDPEHPVATRLLKKFTSLRKADIINDLVFCFNFSSYLEYNKPRCELAFNEVICTSKDIIHIPEYLFSEHHTLQVKNHALHVSSRYDDERFLTAAQLTSENIGKKYDIIFFDPMHVRPEVDVALKALLALLKPDGILVVHDCFPERKELVSKLNTGGGWCGDTYLAFANFYKYNKSCTFTVNADFGVGLVLNRNLVLDYPLEDGPSFGEFSANPYQYIGLIEKDEYTRRLASKSLDVLFGINTV